MIRTDSLRRDADTGYLEVSLRATRIGVFDYIDEATGKIRRELRPPEEVNHPDSMASLKRKPFTLNHPPHMLNSKNTRMYSKGMIGDKVEKEDIYLVVDAVITDDDAILPIESKTMQEVSCGYTCKLDHVSGVWNGQPYDAIQRDTKYNHVALVKRGRAGSEVRVMWVSTSVKLW